MPLEDIQRLPPASNNLEMEAVFRPSAELTDVTPSYLEFLRNQIELEPRRKDWSELLTNRLSVLSSYEIKKLHVLTLLRIHHNHVDGCTVRVDPHSNAVVHWEFS
jgi:hypothetical protein